MNEQQSGQATAQRSQTASTLALTAGFGLIGVSAFGLMAAGPRVLGQDGYTSLALTWTAVTIIGVGVATPGEQVITRSVASGSAHGAYRAVRRRMLLATPLVFLLAPFLLGGGTGASAAGTWIVSLLVATVGWMGIGLTRGLLAGQHSFGRYSATLALEAAARLMMVGLALLLPQWGLLLLACAVSLPLVASAAMGWWWTRAAPARTEKAWPEASRAEQGNMTAVALLVQVCLSTAQLWLHRQAVDPAVSGAFVTATSYMRIPVMLAGGLMAPLLAAAAKAYAERRRRAVAVKTLEALALGGGGSAILVVGLLAFSNLAMVILYGGDTGLPLSTFAWLGVSTVGYIGANVLTNSLYGCQHARTATYAWIVPALLSTALFAVAGGSTTWLAAAVAVGQGVAALLLGLALLAILPPRPRAQRS